MQSKFEASMNYVRSCHTLAHAPTHTHTHSHMRDRIRVEDRTVRVEGLKAVLMVSQTEEAKLEATELRKACAL